MPPIRVLPDLLVNKIAAGEVVERPASVVKELLENAIDAEARHVQVTIEDGGKRFIRLVDDGCGMSADDLRLAVMPHATSKLETEDDLYRIGTLGFRGEALASIGAVSHLRLVSRPHDCDEAAEVRVSADKIETCRAAGAPPGTTVEVRDLFFNVPARRKFLRATSTEVGHVTEQFARIALAHPQVGLELFNANRLTKQLPAGQARRERIAALFSAELAEALIPIDRDERGLSIQGYAAPPARSKPTAAGLYLFVNGRYVRDRVLNFAIREAYRGLMEHSRYPVVFLFLTLDPAGVDVNVHPTKIEVRWQDTNLVRSQVLSALRETFLRTDLTPALGAACEPGIPYGADPEQVRTQIAEQLKGLTPVHAPAPDFATTQSAPGAPRSAAPAPTTRPDTQATPTEAADLWRSLYSEPATHPSSGPRPAGRPGGEGNDARLAGGPGDNEGSGLRPAGRPGDEGSALRPAGRSPDETVPPAPTPTAPIRPRPAMQLHNTYLVTETEDGLQIIDQHALHERIIYEQLRQRLTTGPLESQRLLLPETLEVTAHQAAVLEERADLLHRLGIEVTPFGSNAVAVQSFPALLTDTDVKSFMSDLIDKLAEPADDPSPELLIHSLLDMMSCKAAIKAGAPLTPQEIESLIARKHLIEKSTNCPHGRPTTLQMHLRELERQFKRT